MTVTLRQLAELVQGRLEGDPDLAIAGARTLGDAEPGDITFVEDAQHAPQLPASRASAAVVHADFPASIVSLIRVADPLTAFTAIYRHLHGRPEAPPHGVDPRADIHPTVQLGSGTSVHPFAVLGLRTTVGERCTIHSGAVIGRHCRIGDDVTIFPNAVLYDGTVLGDRVIVHANAVLGADGFGYRFHSGKHVKVPQLGHVEIADDVEIGACTTIDRGTFGATRVGAGTKIDNLVQVAHNCKLGNHNLIVSQVGIAGSSSTGDYVVLAGQVGVNGHVHIGDGTVVGGKAAVVRDVAPGLRVLGSPARPEREEKRILVCLESLPDLRRDVRLIKQRLGMSGEAAA